MTVRQAVVLRTLRVSAQFVCYAVFAAVIGYFSSSPLHVHLGPGQALIKLSFSHAGAPKSVCRRRDPQELAELAPNMRQPLDCPRERVALLVQLLLDGEMLYEDRLPPSGIRRDGASTVYRRFVVDPGQHRLVARLRDSTRESGFDYETQALIDLEPHENFVVDFRAEKGGFRFL